MRKLLATLCLGSVFALSSLTLLAADYVIDYAGAHASINFRIQHLGFSWLSGRFNKFEGEFHYDPASPSDSAVEVVIDTASVDSNHAERDKHLRSDEFLHVDKYPQARFKSTRVTGNEDGSLTIHGILQLRGVSKNIELQAHKVGEGKDPWGGYRAGFSGTTRLKLSDFGMTKDLGPASTHVELQLEVEGIRQ